MEGISHIKSSALTATEAVRPRHNSNASASYAWPARQQTRYATHIILVFRRLHWILVNLRNVRNNDRMCIKVIETTDGRAPIVAHFAFYSFPLGRELRWGWGSEEFWFERFYFVRQIKYMALYTSCTRGIQFLGVIVEGESAYCDRYYRSVVCLTVSPSVTLMHPAKAVWDAIWQRHSCCSK